jgi:hypothetical protein
MNAASHVRALAWAVLCVLWAGPQVALAQQARTPADRPQARAASVRVTGIIRDEANAISLPGVPVEVVGTQQVVYTDVDGRYTLDLTPGDHQLRVTLDSYQTKTIAVTAGAERNLTVDVGLSMARFAETVVVTGQAIDVQTSTAEAQLISRRAASVITDNLGSQEMRQNGDSDAAAAMSRVTGLSVVDNQYVFVRGLGERYSNTTLSGALIPTTEPDKKVVPLDLFPAGLIDSVQVAKSYAPDKSAEFAGGLVQIVPLKFPSRPVFDLSYGMNHISTATGKTIPLSSLGSADWLGFDRGVRALPSAFPDTKLVRQGIYTPDVGLPSSQITELGRLLGNQWRPENATGKPGQNWSAVYGNRFNKLGVIASASHQYREQFVNEQRRFFRVAEGGQLEAVSDYDMKYGTQRAQLGIVGNVAYQFSSNHRISLENFYSHNGRDEGRTFEGPNTENLFLYRNYRLQFIEEGLLSNVATGEHFFRGAGNSRLDWRGSLSRAKRDEPDLREVLYQSVLPPAAPRFLLADESQSGFRMFNNLNDRSVDGAANWSTFTTAGGRATQIKFGAAYVERTRDFTSRRFRYIPITLTKDGPSLVDQTLAPEALYTQGNIGTAFRFNEETRPTDAYDGRQTTTAGYGMIDIALSASTRLIGGTRVERFDQEVQTFDPFGLFARTITAENRNTDVFPSLNVVRNLRQNMNIRASYSATVNRPEFRELAPFEFTDVVGSRAVRGNANLKRALIQNIDGRWEAFTGSRGIVAASVFYKYFDQPIERVVIGGAQPLVTFQNSDHARNFGVELEAGHQISRNFFVNLNYTFVDSKISLLPEQRTVQTSLVRPLAGQSRNIVNFIGEFAHRGFSARVLYNYFGDRISDVGSNDAPDVVEQGRGSIDFVVGQRFGRATIRLNGDNLNNPRYLFTQGAADQRVFRMGRVFTLSFGYSLF